MRVAFPLAPQIFDIALRQEYQLLVDGGVSMFGSHVIE